MTFKDRIKNEHPEKVNKRYYGGVSGCPFHYGYCDYFLCEYLDGDAEEDCKQCWDREMSQ